MAKIRTSIKLNSLHLSTGSVHAGISFCRDPLRSPDGAVAGGGDNGWVLDGTNNEMERSESKKSRSCFGIFLNALVCREWLSYATIVEDMRSYLRNRKGVAEPEQYLCLPMR